MWGSRKQLKNEKRLYKTVHYGSDYCAVNNSKQESLKWFGNYDHFLSKWNFALPEQRSKDI